MNDIRVFLASDRPIIRCAVAPVLHQSAADIDVVGESNIEDDLIESVRRLQPDVVLVDIEMSGHSSLEAARQIVESTPEASVLLFLSGEREEPLLQALEIGIRGCILKTASIEDILYAIRTIHAGDIFISPSMTERLVGAYLGKTRNGNSADKYTKLSDRERELFPLFAQGRTSQDIAQTYALSPHTVQTYRQRIMKKLNVHSKWELSRYALQKGLVNLQE